MLPTHSPIPFLSENEIPIELEALTDWHGGTAIAIFLSGVARSLL
jgi:hypothetical protein